jgi:hypothetical protein
MDHAGEMFRCFQLGFHKRLVDDQEQLDAVVWQEIMRFLEDPSLLQTELDRRLQAAQTTDPLKRREDALRRDQARLTKSMERLRTGYQENLITLEELRCRMPELRKQRQPSNIFVTKAGLVKVLDFGIAQMAHAFDGVATSADAQSALKFEGHLTTTGVAAGTIGYMSPEQVSAKELDARTDLFSFGAVLYEMATGMMPFRGESTKLVLDSILNQVVVPAVQLNSNVPPKPGRIIGKCLQKDRQLRYQSAADLRSELRQLTREMDLMHGAGGSDPDGSAVPASVAEASHYRSQGANLEQDIRAREGIVLPLPWHRRFMAACAIVVTVGVLAFLFRPTLPPPRVTGSAQVTHDGRDKERMVTDGSLMARGFISLLIPI